MNLSVKRKQKHGARSKIGGNMKKTIKILISLALFVLCLLSMASCSRKLDEVGNFELNTDTLTLSWDRVLGAKSYTVQISGQELEKTSKQNRFSLEHLEPGIYEIKIRANGDGVEFKDSKWAIYPFEREAEDGMRYKLINNNTEYELTGLGTASGDIVMKPEYRGKPITSIADKAFAGNTRITSFVVGENVKSIGDSAFSRCAELKSVTFSEKITSISIGESCFQSCKKLESFAFPESVTVVEDYMFSWCSALKSVTFSSGTTEVSQYAFSNCKSLEKVSLPNTLTFIGEYAFSDCESLTEADLGNSLETIEPYAFYNCIVMSKLNIGSVVKVIDEYAFGNCDGITSIAIPATCESIGFFAFRYCDNLAEVSFLGNALTYIGAGAFYNTKIYEDATNELIIDGWYINCKNKDIDSVNKLPDGIYGIADSAFYGLKKLENFKVDGIKYLCSNAFSGCPELRYVTFDSALESIGAYSFKGCKKLSKVNLGSEIKSIGDYAFSGCELLKDKEITLPKSLTSIGAGAFNGTKPTIEGGVAYIGKWAVGFKLNPGTAFDKINIRNGTVGIANYAFNGVSIFQSDMSIYGINIPNTVEYIGRGAFYKAAASGYAVTVHLPKNLKSVGDYAFYGCYCAFFGTDRALIIPEGTEYIGRSAFYGCESIYSVSIPGTVKSLSPYAFYGCINIGGEFDDEDEATPPVKGYFELMEGIEYIGEKAFFGCTSIEKITIPDSVTALGAKAFYKCEGLKELAIGKGLTEISNYAFYNCIALESITIPEGITSIGKYAFRGCTALKSLNIANTVTSIGSFAFMGAENLNTLVIPESVTSIGKHAFRGMTRSKSIILPSTVSEIGVHAFYGAYDTVIYVYGNDTENEWDKRWNSSYVPVITGCTVSSDKSYLESFVKTPENPENMPVDDAMTAPVRAGFTFIGFSTKAGATEAEYTMETLKNVPSDTLLYTVWAPVETTNN